MMAHSKGKDTNVHSVAEGTELEVLTPDEPGIFGRVLSTLANAGINLRALCVSSVGEKGRFQIVSSDNPKAEKALKTLGYKVRTRKVVLVETGDRIGAGAEIGALLGTAAIDIRYAYSTCPGGGRTLMVFQTSNNRKAIDTLK